GALLGDDGLGLLGALLGDDGLGMLGELLGDDGLGMLGELLGDEVLGGIGGGLRVFDELHPIIKQSSINVRMARRM
ncbi:MAG: hypothetical protein ACO2ZD_13585, partial [Pseudomonadales bacterium]